MKTQASVLFLYRQLLRLYPAGFRERFAEEMMGIAKAAESSEWPLIFGDTSVTIVRSWLIPEAIHSTTAAPVQGQYLSIGETPVKPGRLLQGLVLATAVALMACYVSTVTVWRLPVNGNDMVCGRMQAKMVRR